MAKMTILSNDWLTRDETMERLGIALRTLQTWSKKGKIRWKKQSIEGEKAARLYLLEDIEKLEGHGPERLPRKASSDGNSVAVKTAPAPKPPTAEAQAFKLLCDELREQRTAEGARQERERAAVFLTLREAAAYLRLPKSYVLRAIEEGRLAAIKAAGWRIQFRNLEAFEG